MKQVSDAQRRADRDEQLRQLQALLLAVRGTLSPELDRQISALLSELLIEEPFTALAPAPLVDGEEDRRIVITGLGLVTPFGLGIEPFWHGLAHGQSAVRRISCLDPSGFEIEAAGEVLDFEPRDWLEARDVRRLSRSSQFAVAAARMAAQAANLVIGEHNRHEIGCLIACGSTSMPDTEDAARVMVARGPQRISPFFIPSALPNMPASQVALHLGLHGHCSAISTACAAGAQALGEAAEVIRRGDAEIMFAGGAEASFSLLSLGSFAAIRALSTWRGDPAAASRPFDRDRCGFVPGEGAGVMVLERLSSARRRGAPILAELAGYATTCDAYHVTQPEPHGIGAAQAMLRALHKAKTEPQQVDYINAHATATPTGDLAETKAIQRAFGEYAYSVPISASKSMFGHLTGAAGAVEAAATVLALQHQLIPPTINLDTPDPECDLDYVPHRARPAQLQIAVSNSFGFGGVNVVLVLRKV